MEEIKIENLNELDQVIKDHKHDPRWIQIRGFYNRARWKGAQDTDDHLKIITSLSQSLRKRGYKLTVETLSNLIELYDGGDSNGV